MLTPRKRIKKKDLKEDKLVTFYFQTREWLENNFKIIAGALAVLALVIAVSVFVANKNKRAEAAASVEFAKAARVYQSSDYRNAATMFSTIVDNYSGTPSGKLSRFYLAQSLYRTGDYAAAAGHFKKFSSSFGADEHLKATAMAGQAASIEQQGNFQEAAAKFEAVLDKYPDAPQAAHYALRAARCYELAGNTQKAQALYDKIIKEYPESRQKDDAVFLSAME